MELRFVSLRIGNLENALGSGGDGPVYASADWIWRSSRLGRRVALCRMFQRVIHGHSLPKYLSSDHDPLYRFHQWRANLRVLEVTEIKTVPLVPLSHPFVERLIGTIRREYLDRILFWTTDDLEMKLLDFQHYFNAHRTCRLGGKSTRTGCWRICATPSFGFLPLAEALSRVVPNAHRRMIMNSPWTCPP